MTRRRAREAPVSRLLATMAVVVAVLGGCSDDGARRAARPSRVGASTTTPAAPPATAPATTAPAPAVVEVRYRVEDRVGMPGFVATVDAVLGDPRGWTRAGFRLVHDDAATFAVVLVEPDEAQARCLPMDVYRKYSCQNGPIVVLNAERWRHATPEWTGDLATYREMLVNHEFGHLLGQKHPPKPQCPAPGEPAPVMAQQSTELDGCLPNPWPLAGEIERAARHDLPLAPLPDPR